MTCREDAVSSVFKMALGGTWQRKAIQHASVTSLPFPASLHTNLRIMGHWHVVGTGKTPWRRLCLGSEKARGGRVLDCKAPSPEGISVSLCSGTDGYPIRLPLKITSHLAVSTGTCSGLPLGAAPALAWFCLWLCVGSLQSSSSRTRDLGKGGGASQSRGPLGLKGGNKASLGILCQLKWRGQVQWLTPVIPALFGADAGGLQGQEFESSLANILLGRLRQENDVNLGGGSCMSLKKETERLILMGTEGEWVLGDQELRIQEMAEGALLMMSQGLHYPGHWREFRWDRPTLRREEGAQALRARQRHDTNLPTAQPTPPRVSAGGDMDKVCTQGPTIKEFINQNPVYSSLASDHNLLAQARPWAFLQTAVTFGKNISWGLGQAGSLHFTEGQGGASSELQHFGRLRQADHTRSGVGEQPGQHGEILSLLKIQKLAGCGGRHLQSQLLGKLRQENRLSLENRGCIYTLLECDGHYHPHCTAKETEAQRVQRLHPAELSSPARLRLGSVLFECANSLVENNTIGQVWWLTPAIPALWEAEVGGSLGQALAGKMGVLEEPLCREAVAEAMRNGVWFESLPLPLASRVTLGEENILQNGDWLKATQTRWQCSGPNHRRVHSEACAL
ncbi:hypothetical protein AAY473_027696 [Plecturocebus cupreus]